MVVAGSGLSFVFGTKALMPWFFALPAGWCARHRGLLEFGCYTGLAALTAAWLLLGRSLASQPDLEGRGSVRFVWWTAAIWSVPFLIGPPLLSTDLYTYLAQGAVVHAGLDPYRFGPAALGHAQLLRLTYPGWRTLPSLYGPLFLALATGIGVLTTPHVALGVLGLRLVAAGALVVVARFVPRLAAALGADPLRATWLAVASPLVLVEFVSGGHNDIIMIALILVALTLREEGRPLVAIALCAVAVMVKSPAVIALGFVVLAWVGLASGWRARALRLCESGVLAGLVMTVFSLAAGVGWGWLSASALAPRLVSVTTPTNLVALLSGGALASVGAQVSLAAMVRLAGVAGLMVSGVFCVAALRRGAQLGWARSVGLCLGVVALLGPTVYPWYLAWGFVILACTRPTQSSPGLVALAATVEFAFGPIAMPDGMSSILVMMIAAGSAIAYGLGWSHRHLVRPLPSDSCAGEPLHVGVVPRRSSLMAWLSTR